MGNIGLGEALDLWFSGQKLDGLAIYGVATLIIARVAKIIIYVSAFTVVLDIVGPERIQEFGTRVRHDRPEKHRRRLNIAGLLLAFGLAGLVILVYLGITADWWIWFLLLFLVVASESSSAIRLIVWIGKLLARPNLGRAIRIAAFGFFTLATFADLLTS